MDQDLFFHEHSAAAAVTPVAAPASAPEVPTLHHSPQTTRMIRGSLRSSKFLILAGIPGTGKGVTIERLAQEARQEPTSFGFEEHTPGWPGVVRVTPHDEMGYSHIVGTLVPDGGEFRWSPGSLLRALEQDAWLYIDELNRGELDKILGAVLPWLSGQTMEVGRESDALDARPVLISWDTTSPSSGRRTERVDGIESIVYFAGEDFRILGTLNPEDADRVFTIGRALGRRARQVAIPPVDEQGFSDLLSGRYTDLDSALSDNIAALYVEHGESPGSRLGPAAFLDMAEYVLEASADEGRKLEELAEEELKTLTAEAYLLGVGRDLKVMSPSELNRLAESDAVDQALGPRGWEFVVASLRELV